VIEQNKQATPAEMERHNRTFADFNRAPSLASPSASQLRLQQTCATAQDPGFAVNRVAVSQFAAKSP
jgi:hypothetical protein